MRILTATGTAWLLFVLAPIFACIAQGQKAPQFTLHNLDGDTVSLGALKGKTVVIDFWVLWCETCRDEIPKIHGLHKKYADKGVVVLGVHEEEKDASKVKAFVKNAGIDYTVLLDPEEKVAEAFAIEGTPSVIIVGASGKIAGRFRELDGKAEKRVYAILDSLTALRPPDSSRH
jgi:peroxiredoxin